MSERWMKRAANPAVSSSDAGISAISSRLRALTEPLRVRCPAPAAVSNRVAASRRNVSLLKIAHEALRVVARAQLVVGERVAAGRGHALEGDTRAVDHRVELDAEREVVREAAV